MTEEFIPPAPQFCMRLSPTEAVKVTKINTANSLIELGAKIGKDLNEIKKKEANTEYHKLMENVNLANMLNEYFQLDETSQKARMLDLFNEITKLRKLNKELSKSVEILNKKSSENEDIIEEYTNELGLLEKKEKNFRKTINENNQRIVKLNIDVVKLNESIKSYDTKIDNRNYYIKILLFINFVLISYIYYYNLINSIHIIITFYIFN